MHDESLPKSFYYGHSSELIIAVDLEDQLMKPEGAILKAGLQARLDKLEESIRSSLQAGLRREEFQKHQFLLDGVLAASLQLSAMPSATEYVLTRLGERLK